MRQRDTFVAGYAPSAASPYFSSLALLAEASRGAEANLLHQIGEESDRVVVQRDEARRHVARAAAALAALGVDPPPPPEPPSDVEAYPDWAEAVFDAVNGALAPGSAEAVAHLLGHVLGEGMATLDALAVVARLRATAPEHMLLRIQGQSLEHERAVAERRLGKLAAHPLLPDTVRTAVATAAHQVSGGPGPPEPLVDLALVIEAAIETAL